MLVQELSKTFRLLGKIASRVDDLDLWPFFYENLDLATELVKRTTKDALPMDLRLRIYRWVSCQMFDKKAKILFVLVPPYRRLANTEDAC